MSTAILINTNKSQFLRFAWKEYRMLRGFWLALVVLGLGAQLVLAQLLDRQGIATALFAAAWGTAALYAVGAAVTLFSAESEERTRGYLQLLPGQWLPMFLAKVTLAALSSLALALVLCASTYLFAGSWPTSSETEQTLAVLGIAVVEALVWGLLFSLKSKQPLFAAVAAMAAASFGAQLALLVCPSASNGFTASSYQEAAGYRLLLCLGVFMCDVLIARHWLDTTPSRALSPWFTTRSSALTLGAGATFSTNCRRVLARLMWQTWRESWRPILAVLCLSVLLIFSALLPLAMWLGRGEPSNLHYSAFLLLLIIPALFGATVFRADHRGDHRLFLTTHAAWPRYVWLARHLLWFTVLSLLAVTILGVLGTLFLRLLASSLGDFFEDGYAWNVSSVFDNLVTSDWLMAWTAQEMVSILKHAALVGLFATFSVYAVGQLFSLLLRREVLAGFLSLLAAVVVAAWAWIVIKWRLNPYWFLLLPGVGAIGISWFYMPYWFIGRKKIVSWVLAAIMLGGTVAFFGLLVPVARMQQIALPRPNFFFLRDSLANSFHEFQARYVRSKEQANELNQVSQSWPEVIELRVDGKTLEEYGLAEHFERSEFGRSYGVYRAKDLRAATPAEERILQQFVREQDRAFAEANQDAVQKTLTVIEQPDFSLLLSDDPSYQFPSLQATQSLLEADAIRLMDQGDVEAAWRRLKALARVCASQPSWNSREIDIVFQWSQHPQQSSDLLKQAVAELSAVFRESAQPQDIVLIAYQQARDVVLGQEVSRYAESKTLDYAYQVSFLANLIPGEQERALASLDYLAELSLNYTGAIKHFSSQSEEAAGRITRKIFRSLPNNSSFLVNQAVFKNWWGHFERACQLTAACDTSYLASREFIAADFSRYLRWWMRSEIQHRAMLTNLALAAYRLDHGDYPDELAALTPEYLPQVILDPFTGQPFHYRPRGVNLPISLSSESLGIAPHTPVLWSVGSCNSQLEEYFELGGDSTQHHYTTAEPGNRRDDLSFLAEEVPVEGRMTYSFQPQELDGMGDQRNLVFILPE